MYHKKGVNTQRVGAGQTKGTDGVGGGGRNKRSRSKEPDSNRRLPKAPRNTSPGQT